MKIRMKLKEGVSFCDAIKVLDDIFDKEKRIKNDIHTNKHFVLMKGRMCKIGDGTGKYWELLCNSRIAQAQAHELMRI